MGAVFVAGYAVAWLLRQKGVALMFPLSSTMELTQATTLGLALVIGLGFGFFLEKAGFGSTRKLAAVFYFYDMAVVKVMFTAIVTAMVGLFVLSSAGALDLAELYIEPTNYPAAIIGGLVFGVGFIVGGYCPGTSVTAARHRARSTAGSSSPASSSVPTPTPSSSPGSTPGSPPPPSRT